MESTAMEVILNKNVPGLGSRDELVKVSAGYGRNYLFPRGLAVLATASQRKVWSENVKQSQVKREKLLSDAKALASQLSSERIEIRTKVNEGGGIFGSITPLRIAGALKEKGFAIDKESILIESPIKREGEHTVTLVLSKEVKQPITLAVLPEEA